MEHLITDESVAAHRHAGRYLAVCGAQVLAASLTAPEDRYCRPCLSITTQRSGDD
jgi:hypothetical protein